MVTNALGLKEEGVGQGDANVIFYELYMEEVFLQHSG